MYSQHSEEVAILRATDGMEGGPSIRRFLDVGAFHATQFSNTRALFELGWSGVMIEPSPGPMKGLLEVYGSEPRISLIQAAVSSDRGLVPMFISGDAVSTTEQANYELWKKTGGFIGTMLVPAVTLEELSNQFGGFDFINIDAEGPSADLFLEILTLGWEPRCFCVEHDGRFDAIQSAATERGYVVTKSNSCNLVLVKK